MGTKKTKEQDTGPSVEKVSVEDIIALRTFQVRTKIDTKTARQYAVAMQAGQTLPPVRLARIKGQLVLIDGWHRIEARRQLAARATGAKERAEWLMVPATIEDMSEGEARWASATANLTHGKPLTPKEKRRVFERYMRAGRYRKADGTPKSSRQISKELQGALSHTNVLAKIKERYPKVYEDMRRHEDEPKRHEGGPPERQPEELHMMRDDALSLLEEARGAAALATDQGERRAIYEAAKALVAALEAEGVPEVEPEDF